MAITVPTADDVQALYDFIMERANEEHAATMDDDTMNPDAMARFWRISNSNKFAITCTTAYLLDLLNRDDVEQATLTWDHMTAAGEQWKEHPDFLPVWENAKLAQIRQQLAGG
ncbi:hypothetical protein ABT124_40095 [Streptomyces sp. NPDC001982]|uniref:hypothetical protein n=1 Tax=Streptomyces sp. NPDC001982 TaxID=3154405 RepID=UPI003316B100